MNKEKIYEAREELALEYGKAIILKDIEKFDKINHLIGYRKKAIINLGKDIVAAGKKVTNALIAAAEAYVKEGESANKENDRMTEKENPVTEDVLDPDIFNEPRSVSFRGLREAEVLINFDLSKIAPGKVFELEKLLREMGINFDAGTDFKSRDWEWDWSLSGPVNVFFKGFVEDNPNNRYLSKSMKKRIKIQKGDEGLKDAEGTD